MAAGGFVWGPDHVKQYLETDGEQGYDWMRGTTVLLLTTKGRRSGEPRVMPLIFREDDGNYVIVASRGGSPQNPAWYLNLKAEPDVEVQVRGDRFNARARTAEGEERERLWKHMLEVWPDYETYQAKTERRLPVVVLERS